MTEGTAGVNLFGDEWEGGRDRPGWQWKHLPVGRKLGAKKIGAGLYELAPGQRTFPYHWHQLEEEWLIVLRGEPTLRDPSGESGRSQKVTAWSSRPVRTAHTASATTRTGRCES